MDKEFELRPIKNIEFKSDFGQGVFNNQGKDSQTLYDVKLEYNSSDEFFLTTKIDAQFFQRKSDERKGILFFQVSDLDWAADQVVTLQDKVRVLEPYELIEKVKIKINKMAEIYR